jgi:hypothetical protein
LYFQFLFVGSVSVLAIRPVNLSGMNETVSGGRDGRNGRAEEGLRAASASPWPG